ncbi:hypothetical protein HKX48_004625 [Thoreauomyces humboldtii]|nr:hypothetical protein HKX48_004625 [Thoreauomyces humboldtii]
MPRARKLIEEHGGKVADLQVNENQLFMKLTGPDVKASQPGFFSTQYLEDSVAVGHLLNPEAYASLAGNRTVGRNPFTAAEQQLLVQEVSKFPGKACGNDLYKMIAEANPAHTWQAWRDKALSLGLGNLAKSVKPTRKALLDGIERGDAPDLSKLPGEKEGRWPVLKRSFKLVMHELLDCSKEHQRQMLYRFLGKTSHHSDEGLWQRYVEEILLPEIRSLTTESQKTRLGKRQRVEFEDHDDILIRDFARSRHNQPGTKSLSFWTEFSVEHANHGPESWKTRYLKTVYPAMEEARKILEEVAAEEGLMDGEFLESALEDESQPPVQNADAAVTQSVNLTGSIAPSSGNDADFEEDVRSQWQTQASEPAESQSSQAQQDLGEGTTPIMPYSEVISSEEGEQESTHFDAPPEFQTQGPGASSPESSGAEEETSHLGETSHGLTDATSEANGFDPQALFARLAEAAGQTSSANPAESFEALAAAVSHDASVSVAATAMDTDVVTEEMFSQAFGVTAIPESVVPDAEHHNSPTEVATPQSEGYTAHATTQELQSSPLPRQAHEHVDEALPPPPEETPASAPHTGTHPTTSSSTIARPASRTTASQRETYYARFDVYCAQAAPRYNRQQCQTALSIAGGSISRAKRLLRVGMVIDRLAENDRRQCFDLQDDARILNGTAAELIASKGLESVERRQQFLATWAGLHYGR